MRHEQGDLVWEIEHARLEASTEAFDRMSFARHALELIAPAHATIALCEGIFRVRVETGRAWGNPRGGRWAMISVPPRASRRAIALAMAELADEGVRPYVLDVLLHG
jgi:hypothetical protein